MIMFAGEKETIVRFIIGEESSLMMLYDDLDLVSVLRCLGVPKGYREGR